MRILRLEILGDRCHIITDEGYACSASLCAVADCKLKAGSKLTEDMLSYLVRTDEVKSARQKAAQFLARRPYCKADLIKKLCEKGINKEIAQNISAEFEEKGYINDYSYAVSYVNSLISRGYGRKKVIYELKNRGYDEETIDKLSEIAADSDNIRKVIEAKLRGEFITSRSQFNKVLASLLRKGFSYGEFSAIIKEYCLFSEDDYESC
jgi:regulatory protein